MKIGIAAMRFCGFSLVGVCNTLLSAALIYAFIEWLEMDCRLSYAAAYAITILVAYVLNALFVFRRRLSLPHALRFCTSYLVGMILGVVLLHVLRLAFPDANPVVCSYAVLCVTTVFNFALVNLVFESGGSHEKRSLA